MRRRKSWKLEVINSQKWAVVGCAEIFRWGFPPATAARWHTGNLWLRTFGKRPCSWHPIISNHGGAGIWYCWPTFRTSYQYPCWMSIGATCKNLQNLARKWLLFTNHKDILSWLPNRVINCTLVKDLGIYFKNAIATATNTNISDQRESSSSGISWRLVQGNSKWFTTFQYVNWKMVVPIKWRSLVQKR